MSTRCVYEITDGQSPSIFVYQHWDGYPEGAVEAVKKALPFAWPLPRFEPDEFGAALIAANKTEAGNYRIIPTPKDIPGDIEFWYLVRMNSEQLELVVRHANGTPRETVSLWIANQ